MDPLFKAKIGIARAAGVASRASGRGGGTTLPGRLLLRLDGRALGRLGAPLDGRVTLVSASNGKTTTASMIASAMTRAGRSPVHNRAGSNMAWGVATALLDQSGDEGLFEVDEAWLPEVASQLQPATICLGNLFRDQLDRYGELESIVDDWAAMARDVGPGCTLVLNADDPLIAGLGADHEGLGPVSYFGIDDARHALTSPVHASDANSCRRCGGPLEYEVHFLGHLGHYKCANCDWSRPAPDVVAKLIELDGMRGSTAVVDTPAGEVTLNIPLPGLYNVYNALGALATCLARGIAVEDIAAGIGETAAVFGRVETIPVEDRDLAILLIKNPVGANEVLRTLVGDESGITDLWLALNDRTADGHDISWVWDADFEGLAGKVSRVTCSGTRAAEMALRLKYAGVDPSTITVDDDIAVSVDSALAAVPEGGTLYALPTYTALLELRTLLAKRGLAKDYWE